MDNPRFQNDEHRDDNYYLDGHDHGTRDTWLIIAAVFVVCMIIANITY